METQQLDVVYYKDEDVLFQVNTNSEGTFLHCEVYNWKPSVLKKAYKVFAAFLNEAEDLGITNIFTVTPNPKFAKLFGGRVVLQGYIDGVPHEVISWEKIH